MANEVNEQTEDLRRRQYAALKAGGRPVDAARWRELIDQAKQAVADKWTAIDFNGEAQSPLPTMRPPNRIVPGDYIAMRAEELLGLEAQLADALFVCACLRDDNRQLREKFAEGYRASIAVDAQALWDVEAFAMRQSFHEAEAIVALVNEVRGYRKAAGL